ncbi:type II CRISPR RNA-guided endonuclease Cas9 [Alloscardovia macacae]|uniref:CRISPR-associated endonuclease Cas9 n=1 Tax=Alloscardovia macacae TaxID=1160091 RepID=A0A261F7M3_9BIFI|nr:type II CRISPR RNA-guided endonuclease Cas9 [Alloscardovia macacae]OZG55084.1 type II CRISPR RNA-guided endonuclease Cas9 [Alloscardovia macacae]
MLALEGDNLVNYAVGLDLGNGSVGWCALNESYRLIRAKGKELIGARLFNPANTAEDRRMRRTMRRRLSRRRWRLRMLDGLFMDALSSVDSNFLVRRKYSWVHKKDQQNHENWYAGVLFDSQAADKEFYAKYPTIYHLRKALMEDTSKHDIREVYLAVHHILKYRGNFLTEGDLNTDDVFDDAEFMELLNQILSDALRAEEESECVSARTGTVYSDILNNSRMNRTGRAEAAADAVDILEGDSKLITKILKAVFKAIVGNAVDLVQIFNLTDVDKEIAKELKKLNFTSATYDDDVQNIFGLGVLSDEQTELVTKLYEFYSKLVLKRILGSYTTFSDAQISSYEAHKQNLAYFTALAAQRNVEKKAFSRMYEGLLSSSEETRKAAKKEFATLLAAVPEDAQRKDFENALEEDRLFPKQRTSDNGVVPYQVHLQELHKILQNQGQYYPFLLDTYEVEGQQLNKIEGLLKFRVPYYVGPLVSPEDMQANGDNAENHWMVRKEGRREAITPWNFNEIVDKDASGRKFITRLTGSDTFLFGESTLPQHSLLYEEYMVLSELNNVRMSARVANHYEDKKRERLRYEEKQILLNELFKTKKSVTKKAAEQCLMKHGMEDVHLFGLADEKKFVSSLSTYHDLSSVLGRAFVDDPMNRDLLEQIVELQTVFEDRGPLKHQLSLLDSLTDEQIDKLSQKHYTGWGRLSKKLLGTSFVRRQLFSLGEIMAAEHTIMDVMRAESVNLMEIIRKPETGAQEWIDEQNKGLNLSSDPEERLGELIGDLAVSPKVKRGVYQAIRVIDDITCAVGNPPQRIFLEMADEVQATGRTSSRKNHLDELFKSSSLKKEFDEIAKRLMKETKDSVQNDKLYLYYIQLGKDMYTGEEIEIDRLQDYDVDHIVPQALTKDDSLDNRVLVKRTANARKSDSTLYTTELVQTMYHHWAFLHDHKFISDKKFRALTRTDDYSQMEKDRFVNRSLVDTRQIMANVSTVLRAYYEQDVEVYTLNSEITHDMRSYLGYAQKSREINDYHHAQDALCIASAGQFMVNRQFMEKGSVSDGVGHSYNVYLNDYISQKRTEAEEKGMRYVRAFGFVVGSMRSVNEDNRVNPRTGEIVWDESDADYLRHVMAYKKMLVTKRVGDVKTHALYNESRYGREKTTAKTIAFDKKRMATELYGGFGSPSTSSMMLVYVKGKARLVSITEAEQSALRLSGQEALPQILDAHGVKGATVLLDEIMPGQLLKYSASLVTIPSAGELNNAIQLWLPQNVYAVIDTIVKASSEDACAVRIQKLHEDEVDVDAEVRSAFEMLLQIIDAYFPLYSVQGKKGANPLELFMDLEFTEKQKALKGFLTGTHAGAGRADLKNIGLSGMWGRKQMTGELQDIDEFIFQSPTGLFETRMSVAELKRRAGVK